MSRMKSYPPGDNDIVKARRSAVLVPGDKGYCGDMNLQNKNIQRERNVEPSFLDT